MAPEIKMAPCHPDAPLHAKGKCFKCYRAAMRLERRQNAKNQKEIAAQLGVPVGAAAPADPDEPSAPAIAGLDTESQEKYVNILWGWIDSAERASQPITRQDGSRNYEAEIRLQEVTSAKALCAARILGRKFVGETKETSEPQEIPVAGLGSVVAGWAMVATNLPTPPLAPELTQDQKDKNYDA